MKDLAVAARGLRKAPVFAVVAIASLALAVGPNAAIFALIDAVLLRPLPGIAEPERLASVYHRNVHDPEAFSGLSWPDYEYYESRARSFASMLAYVRLPVAVRFTDRVENVSSELVSDNYLRTLGVRVRLGRDFERPERERVALIGERLWEERFGRDAGVIGRAISIGGNSFTVAGVVPADFRGIVLDWGKRPQIWIPMRYYREAAPMLAGIDVMRSWGMQSMLVTGRLAKGVSAAQAAAEIEALAARIDEEHPERMAIGRKTWVARAMPLVEARFWPGARGRILTVLAVLSAVAAGVLLIACANLISLLLTRAAQREREINVRIALGARAGALLRLLLAESVLLAVGGCAVGLVAGLVLTRAIASFPKLFSVPLAIELGIDWRVVVFSAAVGLMVSVIAGLTPIRQCLRGDLAASLRAVGASARGGRRTWNTRNLLTAAQIALSLALLVEAGLFVRTLRNAAGAEPFLRAGNLLIASVEVPYVAKAREVKAALAGELVRRVKEIPAVEEVALASVLPMSGMRSAADVTILDPRAGEGITGNVDINAVSPGFLALAGARLLRGRDFTAADTAGSPMVAVVNQLAAEKYWNGDAIGRRIQIRGGVAEVVGIVRDSARRTYRAEVPPRVYFPITQRSEGPLYLVARTRTHPLEAVPAVRAVLGGIERDAVLESPQTLAGYASVALAQERMAAWCLSALAVLALILSLGGLYGTVAYSVVQRRGEIGIRVALGASSLQVVKAILRPVALLSVVGLVAGSALCVVSMPLSRSLLFGVEGTDAGTWLSAALVLCLTALAAGVIPAAVAARVDPAGVLRGD